MNLGGLFDLDALEEKIAENEARMAEQGFWDDQEKAQEVIAENNDLKAKFETFHELAESISDLGVSLELLQEIQKILNNIGHIYVYPDRDEARLAITRLKDLN